MGKRQQVRLIKNSQPLHYGEFYFFKNSAILNTIPF